MEESLATLLERQQAWAVLQEMAAGGIAAALPNEAPGASGKNSDAARLAANGWQPDLRYRSLIEKLPCVTFIAALDDTVEELYISPQIETLLGYTQKEWLENPLLWYRQLHPDDKEAWVAEFARTCSMGTPFRVEYRMIARDGRVVWVQGQCQVIRDDNGQPMFLQGIAFDITTLKEAADVQEARIAAEMANKAKSEFLARMSHEIRTPLNGVVGMIDLLRGTHMSEGQMRYTQLAQEAADSLLNVINDILDFSKIEAGKVEIEATEFDFHKLLEDLTELLAPVAAKKKLALTCVLRPEVPWRAVGDPNRIRQVLTNLVNNALKFTPNGSVNLRAALESRSPTASVVRVEVEDTGIGIPPERLDRLFKSFSQVDSSTTRKFGGTGLGLVISKQLVELMGGEIGIKSEVGRGTTFWFTLKLKRAAGGDVPETFAGVAEALSAVRVLVVESEPRHRKLLADQIEGRLSRSSQAVSIEGAMKELRRAAAERMPFSVALLPFGGADAMALVAAVQADAAVRNTKLIAVMDIDDRTDESAIRSRGFVAQLHRPLLQSRLMDAIASVTIDRKGEAAEREHQPVVEQITDLKGLHFLVAEDNEMNQFVTQETLRRVNCTCEIVGDGALAVEASQARPFTAVLMDCQMPGMDGLEATRRIREIEAAGGNKKHIPVIALTAEAIQGDRERCIASGMDGYVTKPINPKELFAAIRSIVPAKIADGENRPAATSAPLPAKPAAPVSQSAAPAEPIHCDEPSDQAPIDIESLLIRCMKDAAFAKRTLEKFDRRASEDVELIRKGIAAGDLEGATRMARNLNSVASQVSAAALGKIAWEIEQAGARHDATFALEQLERLAREAKRCSAFIPQAIDQMARRPGAETRNFECGTKNEEPKR
ncbi:MAG TPA: ATP-binding protein [Tepidisphaeraceae bacterium]|nr:ATP-binding protein [Tepidisphaeraceae bacterium]